VSPIRSDADLALALAEIDELLDQAPADRSREGARLEILSELVHAYEQRNNPVPPPDPLDAIRFRMDRQGIRRRCECVERCCATGRDQTSEARRRRAR